MIAAPEVTETVIEAPAERPIETRTAPMKLSEALRLGSMSTKQAIGTFLAPDGSMCAVGTIAAVYGYNPLHFLHFPEWDFMNRKIKDAGVLDPDCFVKRPDLVHTIIHLNDHHRMPRNVIADRLEKLGL